MIVTRLKTARYNVYTLVLIVGFLPPLPQCLQEILHSETSDKLEWSLRHSSWNLGTLPPRPYIVCGNSLGVWSKGNDDFKICHGITCMSCYFPESVSYWAMGRSIPSLHYIFLITVTLGQVLVNRCKLTFIMLFPTQLFSIFVHNSFWLSFITLLLFS